MKRFSWMFRVRTLLVMIALSALAMGSERMYRNRLTYLSKAEFHDQEEERARNSATFTLETIAFYQIGKRDAENDRQIRRLRGRMAEDRLIERYHAQLNAKYVLAASSPWMSVEADPPHPFPNKLRFTKEEWDRELEEYPWLPVAPVEGYFPDY